MTKPIIVVKICYKLLYVIQVVKRFLVTTKIFAWQSFFSSFFLLFSSHTFQGLAGAFMNPGSFYQTLFLYIHLFV